MIYGLMSAVYHFSRDEINQLEFPVFFGYWNAIEYVLTTQYRVLAHQVGQVTLDILKKVR